MKQVCVILLRVSLFLFARFKNCNTYIELTLFCGIYEGLQILRYFHSKTEKLYRRNEQPVHSAINNVSFYIFPFIFMGSEQTEKKLLIVKSDFFFDFSDLLPEINFSRFCEHFHLYLYMQPDFITVELILCFEVFTSYWAGFLHNYYSRHLSLIYLANLRKPM